MNCCKRLGVRGLVLQVRSWSGNDVQINLHQTDCYSLFWQESARSPGTAFTLWGPGPDREEAGLSWQLLRVTSTQLSLLRERGVQEAAGPQAPQVAHTEGAGPSDRIIHRWLLSLGCQGGDGGEVHCHFKTWNWPVSSHGEGSGALQVPACSLGPPAHLLMRLRELKSPEEKARIQLLPHSPPEDHHSTDCWLNSH